MCHKKFENQLPVLSATIFLNKKKKKKKTPTGSNYFPAKFKKSEYFILNAWNQYQTSQRTY